ncbi:MAG: hypothetical protein LBT62_01865 [Deltaproteobacteria bacterium]|jgi:hypothetical protein|nr:hypothetical protein [Deltaproteobacteria bacterium]
MSSLTCHRKSNGATYVYRRRSCWDKEKKRSNPRQVCVGKLHDNGEIICNRRFRTLEARAASEKSETTAESLLIGQSLVLARAAKDTGLERVLRSIFESRVVDELPSLSWAAAAGCGQMDPACVWLEQNNCPARKEPLASPDISRILASVSQSRNEEFLGEWIQHGRKGLRRQYRYDLTSNLSAASSSQNMSNPLAQWDRNSDKEDLRRINMLLLACAASRIPTYYELRPCSMSDAKTL